MIQDEQDLSNWQHGPGRTKPVREPMNLRIKPI